jgi:hypothetical protein
MLSYISLKIFALKEKWTGNPSQKYVTVIVKLETSLYIPIQIWVICTYVLCLTDTSLRDGLFHEYKKYGKVNAVLVAGAGDERYAVVSFRK